MVNFERINIIDCQSKGNCKCQQSCFLLQYPSTLSAECLPDQDDLNCANAPGTLPTNADISPAARDLLKRLLQPDPRLRLRNLLGLQRIAFYMGYDIQSYMLKKVINNTVNLAFSSH